MTTIDPETLRRELLLDQAMNRQLDALVRRANQAVKLLKTQTLDQNLSESKKIQVSQLRNLLNVAVETGSLEVVVNFIRYQIARNKDAWGGNPQDFGHQVIAALRGPVRELTEKVVAEIRVQDASFDMSSVEAEAFSRLMTLYLGYLNRAFYYAKRTGNFDDLEGVNRV